MNNNKEYQFSFEKLEVWQLAKDLVLTIYGTSKKFPGNEKYGLVSQMNRAAVSIASNIAEGSSRMSKKDQAHFSQLAYSSLMELVCQLDICKDLDFIKKEDYVNIRNKMMTLSNKINALYQSQKCRSEKLKKVFY
jgi:four helix bundle protein